MRRGKTFFIFAVGVTALALLAGACQADNEPEAQVTDTEHGVTETPESSAPADSTGIQETQSGEGTTESADTTASSDIVETVTIQLAELNDSGQSGVATLTAMGDQTEVMVTLTSGAAGIAQPIHIHEGSCDTLGGVAFPLTSVVDGASTTVVEASVQELETSSFAINVHKSADEISTFVACGNVSETSTETAATEPASDDAMTSEEPTGPQVESNIQSFQLEDLTITVGTTVTWTNLDNAPHTSTSGDSPVKSSVWDTGTLTTNNSGSITFSEAGTFAYFCTIHPSMTGTVTVTEEGDASGESATIADEPTGPQVESNIQSFQLEDLTITVGTTVTWTNLDNAPHTSTSGDSPVGSGVWDTGTLTTSNTGSITFSEAGTFAYFCTIHPSMTGTVTVNQEGPEY